MVRLTLVALWKGLMRVGFGALAVAVLFCGSSARAHAATQPVPSRCDASVNQALVQFIGQHQGGDADQDNIMVCGTMLRSSYAQHATHSGSGAHHVLVITAPTSNGAITVEVVTNDDLDGVVTAKQGDPVVAFGQAYVDPKPIKAGGFTAVAGVHEPHCATHAGADDGWVVVAGKKYPPGSCSGAK
jgi:hypothetical protein